MAVGIIEAITIQDNDFINIKFEISLRRASITNQKFKLYKMDATPSLVSSAFHPIDLDRDYNSLSRILKLYFTEENIEPETDYKLEIAGLQNAVGVTLPTGEYLFTTDPVFEDEYKKPEEPEVIIEDHSISDVSFGTGSIDFQNPDGTPSFGVSSITPKNGSIYLAEDENSGVIEIGFSGDLDPSQVNADLFKTQRKKISQGPSRWENLYHQVHQDGADAVKLHLPSIDATPTYAVEGSTYYEPGYKYRAIISRNLTVMDEDEVAVALGVDYEINYVSVLEPAFVDPDEILAIFPDAEPTAVFESIHRASLEVQYWVPKATAENLSPLLRQYIIAAVACDLSQRYGFGGADAYSITLGDLSVTDSQSSGFKGGRGTATTWCEIASALRTEVKYGLTGMKGVVRGSKLPNPIPKRSIDKKHSRIHLQGTLDDAEGPPQRF